MRFSSIVEFIYVIFLSATLKASPSPQWESHRRTSQYQHLEKLNQQQQQQQQRHIRVYQDGREVDLTTILPPNKIRFLKERNLVGDDVNPSVDICSSIRRLEDLDSDALLTKGSVCSPDYSPPSFDWGKQIEQKITARRYPGCYLDVTVGIHRMLRVKMKDYSMLMWSGEPNDFCTKSYLEFSSFDLNRRLQHSRKVCCPRGAIPRQEIYLSPARTSFVRIRFVAEEPMIGRGWDLAYELLPETAALR